MGRKDEIRNNRSGGYIETTNPSGYNVLINGTDKYLNFNSTSGLLGYGFRDNGGVMEFKNSSGTWVAIGAGGGTGDMTKAVYDPANGAKQVAFAADVLKLDQTTPQTITGGQPIQDTLTASQIVATDTNKKLQTLPVATYPDFTELSYVKGVTSAIQTQINSKVTANGAITGATKTKITYDAKGLVTAGADATTADIADSSNKRYVTDAQLTVIGNTSGTNTGDVTVLDSDEIDFTLTGQQITATIKSGSIDETKLDTSTNASLDLADGSVQKSTYDAHSILYATTDNTPTALTVGEQTVVGRATGGNITAISIDSDLSSVSANDDTIPSAKATKTALDLKAPLASPTFTGTVTLPTTTLGEASFQLDQTLSADGKRCGITESGTGGETLAFGELCYFKASDSKWYKAKADSTTTSGPVKLGFCVLAGASTTTEILLYGKIRADALFPTLTIGAPVFISGATAGAITTTAPTTTDYVVRMVGYGNTGDELYVQIDNSYYTYQ